MNRLPPQGGINISDLKPYGNRFVRALGNRLASGEPSTILLQGDSTSNGPDEWFYLTMAWLVSKYPAYTVVHKLWEDANQRYTPTPWYGTPMRVQTGSNGDAYAEFNGASGNYISTPYASSFDIAADFDIRAKIALTDWTPASSMVIAARSGGVGDRVWYLGISTFGRIYLVWSPDGTNIITSSSSVSPTVADGDTLWIKATLDVDNGSGGYEVKFYTGSNGWGWTQLGTTVTGGSTTSIYTGSTYQMELGSRGSGSDPLNGKIYEVQVLNGINGAVVASPDLDMSFPAINTTMTDTEGNVWTKTGSTVTWGNGSPGILLLNASCPGAPITYSTDKTRFALQTAKESQLVFINYGHNDSASESTYQTIYEGLCTQLLTKWPNIGIIGVTQNPEQSPRTASQIATNFNINNKIMQALAKNNYGCIDAYRKFKELNDTSLIQSDGIHPTVLGSVVWAQEAINFMQPAVA